MPIDLGAGIHILVFSMLVKQGADVLLIGAR